jgi:hypothetical protein
VRSTGRSSRRTLRRSGQGSRSRKSAKESEAANDNDGIAAARALESLYVRIERYKRFLVEHNARSDEMDSQQWARELIQEGLRFWGQVSGAALWGEFFFCKMVGISCDVEGSEDEGDDGRADG